MLKDLKSFLMRGNVVDLAVAVIIGAAFNKIVTSFVNDIIMPIIGQLTGGTNFTELFFALNGHSYDTLALAEEAGIAVVKYGVFINTVVDFVIVGTTIFFVIKMMEKMKKPAPKKAEAPKGPTQEELLAEIRDLMKKKK